MVHDLDESSFKAKMFDYEQGNDAPLLIKNNTIVEFWVTWCPHCHEMAPRYERFSEDHKQIDCYRVEMEQHPDLADVFDVQSFPTFVFINMNGEMKKWVGEVPLEELVSLAKEAF